MFILPPPTLLTPRVRLRSVQEEDAPDLFAIWSDAEVMEHLSLEPLRHLSQAVAIISFFHELPERQEGLRWAITLRDSGAFVGTIGFHEARVRHRRLELGYELSPSVQGQGLMREVLGAVLPWAFDSLQVRRIEAFVTPANLRSERVLQRAGFRREGELRDYIYARGAFRTEVLWSLLATDPMGDLRTPRPDDDYSTGASGAGGALV